MESLGIAGAFVLVTFAKEIVTAAVKAATQPYTDRITKIAGQALPQLDKFVAKGCQQLADELSANSSYQLLRRAIITATDEDGLSEEDIEAAIAVMLDKFSLKVFVGKLRGSGFVVESRDEGDPC